MREDHRLRDFQNRVLRKIFGPKREEKDAGKNRIIMKFTACIVHRIFLW
jgi:hypothetical protein